MASDEGLAKLTQSLRRICDAWLGFEVVLVPLGRKPLTMGTFTEHTHGSGLFFAQQNRPTLQADRPLGLLVP